MELLGQKRIFQVGYPRAILLLGEAIANFILLINPGTVT